MAAQSNTKFLHAGLPFVLSFWSTTISRTNAQFLTSLSSRELYRCPPAAAA
jgi:hypothetical protein